jgi:hypothetical protein
MGHTRYFATAISTSPNVPSIHGNWFSNTIADKLAARPSISTFTNFGSTEKNKKNINIYLLFKKRIYLPDPTGLAAAFGRLKKQPVNVATFAT